MQNPELKLLWKYITIFYCSTNNKFFFKELALFAENISHVYFRYED